MFLKSKIAFSQKKLKKKMNNLPRKRLQGCAQPRDEHCSADSVFAFQLDGNLKQIKINQNKKPEN